ncbi:MAG: hypothetical protein N2201_06810 [candidate division WOR-3 bacterium]|nr:hypothetical protein [candidate division WOR-3 bacterium]
MIKGNKGLFNKKRFEWLKQERIASLQKLSIKKSVKMMETLVGFANELRDNFLLDEPVSLKIGLKRNKKR